MQPKRIQLSRAKGWRKPENTVVVARPSRWGNPFRVLNEEGFPIIEGPPGATWPHRDDTWSTVYQHAVDLFRERAVDGLPLEHLRGKHLACWCPLINSHGAYSPCHADVLLSLANEIPMEDVVRENTRWAKGEAM